MHQNDVFASACELVAVARRKHLDLSLMLFHWLVSSLEDTRLGGAHDARALPYEPLATTS